MNMMGKNLTDIDKVFRKQLKNYTQAAPENMWGNIEQVLNKKNNSRKISLYKIAAAVIAFAIVGSGLFYISNSLNRIDNSQVIVQNNIQKETSNSISSSTEEKVVTVVDKDLKKFDANVNRKAVASKIETVETPKVVKVNLVADKMNLNTEEQKINKLAQKQILISTKNIELAIVDNRKQNIKSYLKTLPDIYSSYALNEAIEVEKTKNNKWFVGGEFTPLYSYRNITETQGVYNKDFYNSSESPIMSYTGGLNMQYKAISRLTIQAGVYYTTMGQSLDYLSVYANSAYNMVVDEYKDRLMNSYTIENSSGDLSFNSSHVIIDEKLVRVNNHSNSKRLADVSDPIFNELDAKIQQSFQYVEIPVVFRYTLINKNIDLNIIGGFGANLLIGNDVYINYAGKKEVIGETAGVNPVNYNGTVGIGIEYPLNDNINIRLEPSVKYYLNELNSNSLIESHPYSIGIYTGINYSF